MSSKRRVGYAGVVEQVHFVGIGGIGVSALARMFLLAGKKVSGSDQSHSPITEVLERLGARIFYEHRLENLPPGTELLIYTLAVPDDNPELVEARRRGIRVLNYPEALGEISAGKFTIAVSGTHGKTTTTAMLAEILIAAGLDPTVIIGSLISRADGSRTNFIAGKSKYFLVEACEYRRSFLNLSPTVLVITNIDNDHLDYYRDLADIQSAFAELARKIPSDGMLICDVNDPRLQPVLLDTRCRAKCRVIDYRSVPPPVKLRVPGRHNILNAQTAAAAAGILGVNLSVTLGALRNFRGAWRRFEDKGRMPSGAKVFDDYGHHPTEIKATLETARELSPGRLVAIFQPHLYSRTRLLFAEFVKCFADADEVIVTDIYAAREPVDREVSAQILTQAIARNGQTAKYLPTFPQIKDYLSKTSQPNDLVVTIGAGNIFELADDLV